MPATDDDAERSGKTSEFGGSSVPSFRPPSAPLHRASMPRALGLARRAQELAPADVSASSERDVPQADEGALRRERLSKFGRAVALIALSFLGLHVGFNVWLRHEVLDRESIPELVATVAFGALWLLLRGSPQRASTVRAIELSTLFVGTAAFSSMALALPLLAQPESIVRLALTYVLLAYAAYVPGNARRTLLVAAIMTVPLMTCIFLAYRKWDPALYDPPAATWPKGPVGQMAYGVTLYSFCGWAMAVGLSVGISSVIYGLRRQVRDVRRLGQYTLEKKLGEGGMGVVYRASHALLRRPTAVKLLLPDRVGREAVARFEREVRRTAMLSHPNTVTVFDYGRTAEGIFYYAMELLDGASLAEVVEHDGPQPEERVIHVLEQAAAALSEAHDAGLIHRDIKPANILVVDRAGIPDLVKVLDFGLVKDVGPSDPLGRTLEASLTVANAITGTPLYLAPEAITSPEKVDARSDIYALGAVAYWLLAGAHVFGGNTVVEVCSHHLHSIPPPPSGRRGGPLSKDLEDLVLACLAKRPEDRPPSARALRDRLRACASAGQWTHDRAAAWWVRHGDGLRAKRDGAHAGDLGMAATVVVSRAMG
jgi:serine/threonine-protein kinase